MKVNAGQLRQTPNGVLFLVVETYMSNTLSSFSLSENHVAIFFPRSPRLGVMQFWGKTVEDNSVIVESNDTTRSERTPAR